MQTANGEAFRGLIRPSYIQRKTLSILFPMVGFHLSTRRRHLDVL